ncbi:hypothetical protein J6590_017625 [Homalodisca vitripennis]|nr:hypothetical protein J6590_017625 [Homalodisca vitripennis]
MGEAQAVTFGSDGFGYRQSRRYLYAYHGTAVIRHVRTVVIIVLKELSEITDSVLFSEQLLVKKDVKLFGKHVGPEHPVARIPTVPAARIVLGSVFGKHAGPEHPVARIPTVPAARIVLESVFGKHAGPEHPVARVAHD